VEGTGSVGILFRENCKDKMMMMMMMMIIIIIIIITSKYIEEEKYGDLRPGCGLHIVHL
jgi:hypothetical protein